MLNSRPAALDIQAEGSSAKSRGDRRRQSRQRVLKSATIVFGGGNCSISCQILDLSQSGALLMPVDVFSCPGEFVLKPRVGPERNCEVVWRTGTKIGVRYF
jgi:hypothetical protein